MLFLLVGVLMLVMYVADIGPVAHWHLGWVLLPFLLAAAWWMFSDATGMTQRRAMDKMDQRKRDRRERALEALGLNHHRDRQARKVREDAAGRRLSADPTREEAYDAADRRSPTRHDTLS